jgi:hypothetical protein
MADSNYVYLKCFAEGSRLRVRIISGHYLRHANCMFPKDIRVAGRVYRVRPRDVNLTSTRGTWFYSIKRKNVEIVAGDGTTATQQAPSVIYEDTTTDECAICMSAPKSHIINPCGHYYLCEGCAKAVTSCPICRGTIVGLIAKENVE